MNKWDICDSDISFGLELELPDIERTLPSYLGEFEHSEFDIVNTKEPYKNVPVDPAGINPPVGAEINTAPKYGICDTVKLVEKIFCHYKYDFGVSCMSHFHIHTRIAEWDKDIEIIKRIINYVNENHRDIIEACYPFDENELKKLNLDEKTYKKAKNYLRNDGGRRISEIFIENINRAKNFQELKDTLKINKDGKKLSLIARPFINPMSLIDVGTIEFRFIRSTNKINEVRDALRLVRDIILEALKDNPRPFREWFDSSNYLLPQTIYDKGQIEAWYESKEKNKNRSTSLGKFKNRKLIEPEVEKEVNHTFINVLGSNATGKSTRITRLIEYLDKEYGDPTFVIYYSMKAKKEVEIGRIYNTSLGKMFILGRFNTSKKWISLDTSDFTTQESRFNFIKHMFKNYDINYFIQEGFFNNRGKVFTYEALKKRNINVDKAIEVFFLYDDIEHYLLRTNGRTGKNRRLDWAEKSQGWRDNLGQRKHLEELKLMKCNGETETELYDVSPFEREDFFVNFLFGDCVEKKEDNNKTVDILSEWQFTL